jgi:hypothetical protein
LDFCIFPLAQVNFLLPLCILFLIIIMNHHYKLDFCHVADILLGVLYVLTLPIYAVILSSLLLT